MSERNETLYRVQEILMTRYAELRKLEARDELRGNMIAANQFKAAAFEVGQLANQILELRDK